MAVVSNTYPNTTNENTGPLIKRGAGCSVQVSNTGSGGTVGTYQLQSSNDGDTWVNEGSTINSSGITEFTVNKQIVRVQNTIVPSGTTTKVTLYGDAPGE